MAATKITENFPINKMVFFIFNIFLMLISASYLGIGGWLVEAFKLEKTKLDLFNEYYTSMGILMLVVGGLCGLLAFIGFIITFWNKLSILVCYLSVLVLVFLLGMSIGIVGFVYASNVDSRIHETITEVLFLSEDRGSLDLVDAIHTDFKCCGLNGPHDWANWINKKTIPKSCCTNGLAICEPINQFKDGCLNKVKNSIFTDMLMSGAISLAIIFPIILGIVSIATLIVEAIDPIRYRTSKA